MWHEWGLTKMHAEFWCLNVNTKDCCEDSWTGEVLRCSAVGLTLLWRIWRLSPRYASTALFRSLCVLPSSRKSTK